jgi:Domain of unknown function (DUF4145)
VKVSLNRGLSPAGAFPDVSLRCPHCRQQGTFQMVAGVQDLQTSIAQTTIAGVIQTQAIYLGQRRCPNRSCHGHIFVVLSQLGDPLVTYPPERLDFDASEIPAPIATALEEAITCHANRCFTAAAMMVRKTLEELCRDRQAAGDNLKQRILALGDKVLIPKELLAGLDDLRVLGNDAVHVESRVYGEIGKDEIEVAIAFTKEVLKAVYQYTALLAQLRSLKKKEP